MYQSYSALDLTQLQMLLDRVIERIQAQPGQSLITIAGSLVGAYAVKRLLAPPAYPNLAGPPNMSALYGHTREIFSPTGLAFHDSIQDTYGSVAKVNGLMGREDLYISDPRALHEILVKEHGNAFQHDQFFYDSGNVFFGPGILATSGDVHKKQRKGTDAKPRIHSEAYESTFQQIADEMKKAIIKELGGKELKEVDILKWCSAAALELIGQAGFGHTFGIFQGVESEYTKAVKDFFPVLTPLMPFRFLFSLVYPLKPAGLRRKIVDWTPNADVQQIKHIIDIQDEQATAILNDKKARLTDEGEEDAQDIISVLLKNNSQVEKAYQLPEDQIRGQINALVFAGHETTSGALTRTLDILSKHPDAQNRLRAELGGASSTLNYDELQSLPYLDAVCREILRLYPPATQLVRRAYKDWVVPLRYPVKGNNGQEVREIQVKKGTMIYVALRQANRCRETWGDDADLFKPERWLGDLPSSVAEAKSSGIYSSMMTFSAGPRSCIGFKFAILELKVLLSTLIKTFSFAPAGHPVEWRLGLTMAPFEAGSEQGIEVGEQHPRMPIVVSLVD